MRRTNEFNEQIKFALILCILSSIQTIFSFANAQNDKPYTRIVTLEIKESNLMEFKQALLEDLQTAVEVEPGVIALYAVREKESPTQITVIEIYKSKSDHQAHQQTDHFLKYKAKTEGMVMSVVRREMTNIFINHQED